MSDQSIEQEIQAKGLNAPRIKPADIEAAIASTTYFTAAQGQNAAYIEGGPSVDVATFKALGLLTFCVLVLRNGFTVTGESAVASPANFNAEIGKKIAREKAVEKIWPLLGFALRESLYREEQAAAADAPSEPTA